MKIAIWMYSPNSSTPLPCLRGLVMRIRVQAVKTRFYDGDVDDEDEVCTDGREGQ